jgi:hypothetical protein
MSTQPLSSPSDNHHSSEDDEDDDSHSNADSESYVNHNTDSDMESMIVHLPNNKIRSVFHQWLHTYITKCITAKCLRAPSIDLFHIMVSDAMSLFAIDFGKLILATMPGQFFGSKEVVYQAYVCAFFTAAAEATQASPNWEVEVDRYSGVGCLDLIIQQMGGNHAIIQEHKHIKFSKKDKTEGYGESQRKQLTKIAEKALTQIETKHYCTMIRDHVTELCKLGLAFLGPYCAVEGHLLRRDHGGQWTIWKVYTTEQDEARRAEMYRMAPSC